MTPADAWNLRAVADAAQALLTQREPPRAVLETLLTEALAKYYRERGDDGLSTCAWTRRGETWHSECGDEWDRSDGRRLPLLPVLRRKGGGAVKPLSATYRKGGFLWTVVERVGNVALATQESPAVAPRWSVFIVQQNPDREMGGKAIEAAESMPGAESWGRLGWTPNSEACAREIFAEQIAAQAERAARVAVACDPSLRSCNRHDDCDSADRDARERGRIAAEHCHDDCCEECFGS